MRGGEDAFWIWGRVYICFFFPGRRGKKRRRMNAFVVGPWLLSRSWASDDAMCGLFAAGRRRSERARRHKAHCLGPGPTRRSTTTPTISTKNQKRTKNRTRSKPMMTSMTKNSMKRTKTSSFSPARSNRFGRLTQANHAMGSGEQFSQPSVHSASKTTALPGDVVERLNNGPRQRHLTTQQRGQLS